MSAKEKKRLLDDLFRAGEICSNCCYNKGSSASPSLDSNDKQSMLESAKSWDRARLAYHQAQTRKL